jgi:hypothetical protein
MHGHRAALVTPQTSVKESRSKPFFSLEAPMRFIFALLPYLFLSALFHAQTPLCSGCPNSAAGSMPQDRSVCLSETELAAHIATRKPIGPPGLREPRMNSHGTVSACLCFARTGTVTAIHNLSGPPMMLQSVLESIKEWTFRPVKQGGRSYGGCGTLRIRVDMIDSQVTTTIE